jgi:hypothetical protein
MFFPCESYETHKYSQWTECHFTSLKQVAHRESLGFEELNSSKETGLEGNVEN